VRKFLKCVYLPFQSAIPSLSTTFLTWFLTLMWIYQRRSSNIIHFLWRSNTFRHPSILKVIILRIKYFLHNLTWHLWRIQNQLFSTLPCFLIWLLLRMEGLFILRLNIKHCFFIRKLLLTLSFLCFSLVSSCFEQMIFIGFVEIVLFVMVIFHLLLISMLVN